MATLDEVIAAGRAAGTYPHRLVLPNVQGIGRVTIDGKGDSVYTLVGFTGGDYNQWAILEAGGRFRAVPLDDLRLADE